MFSLHIHNVIIRNTDCVRKKNIQWDYHPKEKIEAYLRSSLYSFQRQLNLLQSEIVSIQFYGREAEI